jgi:phasin family protein
MATRKTAAKTPARTRSKPAAAEDAFGLGEVGKLLQKFKLPGIDIAAIVESQRKDMQALADANREAYEGIKALAERRNEILLEALAHWQAAMKDTAAGGGMKRQAEAAKEGVTQAVARFRELAEMEAAARSKAWKILQDRFQDNLANLQKLLQPR